MKRIAINLVIVSVLALSSISALSYWLATSVEAQQGNKLYQVLDVNSNTSFSAKDVKGFSCTAGTSNFSSGLIKCYAIVER